MNENLSFPMPVLPLLFLGKTPNINQQVCHLPRPQRYAAVGQKGATLWMTGLSGSGKSTIAKALEEELVLRGGKHVYRLDGDNIRTGLNRDLGAIRTWSFGVVFLKFWLAAPAFVFVKSVSK